MEEIINVTKSLSLGELKIINQKLHNKLKEEKWISSRTMFNFWKISMLFWINLHNKKKSSVEIHAHIELKNEAHQSMPTMSR